MGWEEEYEYKGLCGHCGEPVMLPKAGMLGCYANEDLSEIYHEDCHEFLRDNKILNDEKN